MQEIAQAAERDVKTIDMEKRSIEMVEQAASQPQGVYAPHYLEYGLLKTSRVFWKASMYAILVAFGAVFDAYAVTLPGNIIVNPGFIRQFGTITNAAGVLELDALHVAAWGGVTSAGQIVGMWVGPPVSDRFGRKWAMAMLAASLLIAIVLEIVAKEWQVYTAAKMFAGIGTGMTQSGLTVYIAEIAPIRIRGVLLSFYSLCFAIGQLVASIALNVIIEEVPLAYRNAFYSEFVLLGLMVPALVFAPESPWYHARRGNEAKAKRCLQRLYGSEPTYNVEQEYEAIAKVIDEEKRSHDVVWWKEYGDCFTGTNGRRTLISFLPLAFQQFLGIGLVFGYATTFFGLAGYRNPFEASVIQSCILLLFIIVSFGLVERVGRRPLLLIGGIIMAICLFVIGGLGFRQTPPGTVLVALTCIWTAAYAVSAGPIGWTYVAETATPRLRAKTAGIAASGTCLFGLIFNYTVPIMLSPQQANWGIKIGLFFGGLCSAGLVVLYFLVPELKGRTFAEMDELFENKVPARQFKAYQTSTQRALAEDFE